jgi:hypothetical protein
METIRYFGSYFLDCIQKHIKHNEETYHDHAKGLHAKATLSIAQILKGVKIADAPDSASIDLRPALIPSSNSPAAAADSIITSSNKRRTSSSSASVFMRWR